MADNIFVAIQGTYNSLGIAIFNSDTCIAETSSCDQRASSHLIPHLETFLSSYSLALPDLLFIAVDQGPGAFTSLRVTIATINGIAYGMRKPLVGVDSLDALAWQSQGTVHSQPDRDRMLIMLNAYGNDVYYRYAHDGVITRGCKPVERLLAEIASHPSKAPLALAGNGVPMHLSAISHAFDGRQPYYTLPDQLPTAVSIGACAWQAWSSGLRGHDKLVPLYMKSQEFAMKAPKK